VRYDHQLHHEERYRSGKVSKNYPGEQGLANGDLSPGYTGRAGWYRAQLYQWDISGVPEQSCDEAGIDGLGESRGMKQKFIEWFTKNNNGCSPAMEDDRSFVYEMTQHMFEAYQAGVAEGEARCAALAAENAGLKESRKNLAEFIHEELDAGYPLNMSIETPATDAFLAEVRAQARNEGINYAASRLAAAFNHGFVDKPLSEVYDVVRMILDTKEELANSTLPAADGLSGEYAEEFLEEFAAQIRKGVQS